MSRCSPASLPSFRQVAPRIPITLAALVAAALPAQTVTVPTVLATAEVANSALVLPTTTNRVQCIYDWTNFTNVAAGQPIEITSI